ncbi:histidine-type phosphatase [Massilia forsythiae]|uniref:Multiple inositol polyphosphate phosphatase 1 n=1 Tax=Massilia forsythiae TaxID=2728020 RepID=A0A7Z2VYT4_9BURK|nr:histidine-type phosphatase [Massilia forsythiae]QJE01575.1 histidine-type phosphatase [Massilia forsythiae]
MNRSALAAALLACLGTAAAAPSSATLRDTVGGTKLPYAPRQDPATYEPAPAGFVPVQLQLVARHGARGLTGMKGELALLNLCRRARDDRALTPLGARLQADLEALIRANAVLGAGVDGVAKPGYGNLSLIGIDEHRGLARRTVARLPALFDGAGAGGGAIVVEHSGVDRARDSAAAYVKALLQARPALAPQVQEAGANRYTLYFHKLNAKTDSGAGGDAQQGWRAEVFRASLAYQAYLAGPALAARLDVIEADPRLQPAAHAVLGRLFRPAFLARLERGAIRTANTGSVTFTGAGGFDTTLQGDGKAVIANAVDALQALGEVHDIAPGLARELDGRDFGAYLPPQHARLLARLKDAEDFYEKGPGLREQDGVTWRMAAGLVGELLRELDGDEPGVHLRFTHAEIMIPLAAALGLPGKSEPLPQAATYGAAAHRWRSADLAPYSANLQWDVYRHPDGRRIVRMLWNEAETDFKPACDGARIAPASHYYDVASLRVCYAR